MTTQIPLDAWQVGPWNRWAYVHVGEVVATAPVARGDGPVAPLEPDDGGLDDVLRGLVETAYADGVAVVHRGRLLAEGYGGEMTETSLHLSQSVGKSVLGLLVGILGIDPDELVTERVPEVAGSGYEGAHSVLALPDFPLLTGMIERVPAFVPMLMLLGIGAAVVVSRKLRSAPRERILLAAIAACAAAQLFNVALLGAFLLAFSKRTGLPALRSPEVLLAGALIAVAFLVWVVAVLATGVEVSPLAPLTLRTVVRELLDYPYFYVFWGFPNEWPLAAAVASVGALVAFHRAARARDPAAGFALLALAAPIVANAAFSSPFEIFRYNAAFNTLFFVFVALAFVSWRELVPALRPGLPRLERPAAALGTTLLVLLATAYDLNPLRGWLALERGYHNDGALYRTFGLTAYSDFKTTAEYVARHAAPHDLIVTPDSREYYNYLGRVDLWLRSARYEDQSYVRDGKRRDLYVDTPLVATLHEACGDAWTPEAERAWRDAYASLVAAILG